MRSIQTGLSGRNREREPTVFNADLSMSVSRIWGEYEQLQRSISLEELEFGVFFAEKIARLEEDKQGALSEFMKQMYAYSMERDTVAGERMCFGGFYAYETLETFSLRKGRSLPTIVVSDELFRMPEHVDSQHEGLIAQRQDLAQITKPLPCTNSEQGAKTVIASFQHLFKR